MDHKIGGKMFPEQTNLSHFWALPINDLTKSLNIDLSKGMDSGEAARRLKATGLNTFETKKKSGPVTIFLNQFKSPIVLILLFATILSAFLQDWIDAVIIMTIVIVSALLSFIQEFNASAAAEK